MLSRGKSVYLAFTKPTSDMAVAHCVPHNFNLPPILIGLPPASSACPHPRQPAPTLVNLPPVRISTWGHRVHNAAVLTGWGNCSALKTCWTPFRWLSRCGHSCPIFA